MFVIAYFYFYYDLIKIKVQKLLYYYLFTIGTYFYNLI